MIKVIASNSKRLLIFAHPRSGSTALSRAMRGVINEPYSAQRIMTCNDLTFYDRIKHVYLDCWPYKKLNPNVTLESSIKIKKKIITII